MILKKILTPIIFGALTFSDAVYSENYSQDKYGEKISKDHSQYEYNGKINKDHVIFRQEKYSPIKKSNILTVTKPDGRIIKYVDFLDNDLKLEYTLIVKNGKTTEYMEYDEVGKVVLKEAQKQFDDYFKKIKIKKGLEDLT